MINVMVQEAYSKIDPSQAAVERMWRRISMPVETIGFSRPERAEEDWDSPAEVSAPGDGITESVFEPSGSGEYDSQPEYEYEDQAPAEEYVERRSQRRSAKHAAPTKKQGAFGRLPLPLIIAAAAVIVVVIVILVIVLKGGSAKKVENTQPALATPASAASEDLNKALEYSGPDWAKQKLSNVESALKEWRDYKATKQLRYFAEKLPHLGVFLNEAVNYDGTEVEANADDTYTLLHWRYMENWEKTSVSPITGEDIPELTQVIDTENTVTVDAAEYDNYLKYIDETSVNYGDYSYIYSVYDAEEAAKLEEIAAKYGLTLRKNDETSQGYGETGDSELQAALAAAVGKGDIYTALPHFDHLYYYPNGSFQSCASIPLSDGRRMYTSICGTNYNEMADGREAGSFTVENSASMTQRSYTAADGTELTISQNSTQAIIYAYLDNCCVVVDMSINPWKTDPVSGEEPSALLAKRESDFQISDGIINFVADYINYRNIGK